MACNVLKEAVEVIEHRRKKHDHPTKNFERIGDMWSVILGVKVTPRDTALCMIALKLCREMFAHHEDNLVDICGYAHCAQECWEHDEEWCYDADEAVECDGAGEAAAEGVGASVCAGEAGGGDECQPEPEGVGPAGEGSGYDRAKWRTPLHRAGEGVDLGLFPEATHCKTCGDDG